MRRLVAEFVGTFGLVFFGCGAIANGLPPTAIAFAFGLAIGIMVDGLGHISGAHFNPAVSIGFAVGGHLPWRDVAGYSASQIGGAVAAALLLRLSLGPDANLGTTSPSGSTAQAFIWEVVLTLFLMVVISAVATDLRAVGQAAGLAIGGAVGLGALVGGPISGGSMNPARSIGPAIVSRDLDGIWLYVVAPTVGAVSGAVLYRFLRRRSIDATPDPAPR